LGAIKIKDKNGYYEIFFDVLLFYIHRALWCFTPLAAMFHLYSGGQFYWWRKPEYSEKTTDLSRIMDKFVIT
jgi:hypothetical protein